MITIYQKNIIELFDWDALVIKTYGKNYSFQQQDDCKERQLVPLKVPDAANDYSNDTIPEKINGEIMGVSFAAWLAMDCSYKNPKKIYRDSMFWERNFYPDVQMIANDLYEKGLLPAGEYLINIDW